MKGINIYLNRQSRTTLYIVAGFYVTVGFVVAIASALGGDRLGTFLGFLIVSGAMALSVLLRATLQVEACLRALGAAIDELRKRSDDVAGIVTTLCEQLMPTASSSNGGNVRILDLAALGPGDPSVLTAATLVRQDYPRLATSADEETRAVNDEPTASSAAPESPIWELSTSTQLAEQHSGGPSVESNNRAARRDLVEQFGMAMRNGDLAGCRGAYAALIEGASDEGVAQLQAQMNALAAHVERTLREAFAERVRRGEFCAALAIGERMCHLLPDRPVSAEFRRIEPHLARRVRAQAPTVQPALHADVPPL